MLLSENLLDAATDAFDEAVGTGVVARPCAAARSLAEVRRAIAALSSAAAPRPDGAASVLHDRASACSAVLAARIAEYRQAVEAELCRGPLEGRPKRARELLREHVAFVLRGLIVQLEQQQGELHVHGDEPAVLRKAWCTALATSVAIEHLAMDLARFRGQPEPRR